MTESPPVSLAYYEAMNAIARLYAGPPPIPPGVTKYESEHWDLVINNANAPGKYASAHVPETEIQPFDIHATHKEFIIICILSPFDGVIGGMQEDEFIEQMKVIAPEESKP